MNETNCEIPIGISRLWQKHEIVAFNAWKENTIRFVCVSIKNEHFQYFVGFIL